jgi:hypothetical protein
MLRVAAFFEDSGDLPSAQTVYLEVVERGDPKTTTFAQRRLLAISEDRKIA